MKARTDPALLILLNYPGGAASSGKADELTGEQKSPGTHTDPYISNITIEAYSAISIQ